MSKPGNLSLNAGELVCLLGANGVGKSTLLQTLAGTLKPLSGEVQIENKSLSEYNSSELAQKLSIVLPRPVSLGYLRVEELVAMGRYPYTNWAGNMQSVDHEIVASAIKATDLQTLKDRSLTQLSDGERQRAMIARALAQDTGIILLDEPTAHLDIPNRVAMLRLMRTLAKDFQKAILLSTHELDLALQAADQIWLMMDQKVITDIPEALVLDGKFEAAFQKDGVSFDETTGTFQLHEPGKKVIELNGDDLGVFWTKRALVREGFRVGESASEISIMKFKNTWNWTLYLEREKLQFASLHQLIAYLSAH